MIIIIIYIYINCPNRTLLPYLGRLTYLQFLRWTTKYIWGIYPKMDVYILRLRHGCNQQQSFALPEASLYTPSNFFGVLHWIGWCCTIFTRINMWQVCQNLGTLTPSHSWDLWMFIPPKNAMYPLVISYIAIENGPVEIVDLPIKNGGSFHSFLLVYQRV